MKALQQEIIKGLVLLALGFLASAGTATAAEIKQTLRFGVMELTPYGFYDKQGNPQGDLFEISHEILKEGNFEGGVVIEPIKRLTKRFLVKRDLDCFIAGDVPFIRDRYAMVEHTGIDVEFGILPRRGVTLSTHEDLKSLRIGLPLGVTIGSQFDHDETLKKVQVKDYETGMAMLARDRIDAIAGVIGSLQVSGKRRGVTSQSYGSPMITKRVPLWLACRHEYLDAKKEAAIRLVTVKLRENGTMDRIVQKYRSDKPLSKGNKEEAVKIRRDGGA